MIRAVNPLSGKLLTVVEFIAEFGANYKEKGVIPKCPCGGCALYIHGAHSPNTTSNFSHMPNKNMECECRNDYNGPLGIPEYDGLLFKDKVCEKENSKKIYQLCLSACGKGNFPVNKYVKLMKKANHLNIWQYKGIELWMVAYILLTLDDFYAKDKNGKEYEYRFVLLEDSHLDLLSQLNEIKVSKIFADSQKEIKQLFVNKEIYDTVDTSWMPDNFMAMLLKAC